MIKEGTTSVTWIYTLCIKNVNEKVRVDSSVFFFHLLCLLGLWVTITWYNVIQNKNAFDWCS